MRPFKTEAIISFLKARTHPDLASLYTHDQEVQVNVAQDGGELVGGVYEGRQWRAWTDSMQTWKSFRIPLNANTEPHYEDKPIGFDLDAHAEGVGMTGWDWKAQLSRWVAFDFDAIVGHSDKHQRKLSEEEFRDLEKAIANISWVELRKSTSGNGRHIYVHLDPVATTNHTEHAALARAILGRLSAITGFDFFSKVDICGGNMWVWHRKMRGTDGLRCIKKGNQLSDIPPNWRDHICVTTGKRKKSIPSFVQEGTSFEELTGRHTRVPLDETHRRLIDWLSENGACWWYDNDHHMLVAHTADLKRAHTALKFKGVFETLAQGTESGDHNCFCHAIRAGGWSVRRYTPGVAEAPTWDQDGAGWTRCFFNRDPDLASVARLNSGVEHPSGGYEFQLADRAVETSKALGANISIPDFVKSRQARIKPGKQDNRVILEIDREKSDDPSQMAGWINAKTKWQKVVPINFSVQNEPESNMNYDDLVRHLTTNGGENYGWVIKSEGTWRVEPLDHVKSALLSCNFSPKEVLNIIGSGVFKAWTIVNFPFGPEYPGDRKWNREAAQLRYPIKPERTGDFPTWQRILNHLGENLNDYIKADDWCKSNGIFTGSDYLMCWVASLFKEPTEPLPYLFLYGPQNSGKSIFHEALNLLITNGVVRADTSLVSSAGFNGELEHAVLCIIEETDLRRNNSAYNRIKDWVTSRQLLIHRKQRTPYSIDNTTHWVQCSNEQNACPVFPGDTRITMIYVDSLKEVIPKKELLRILEKEASDFLTYVCGIELPTSPDRLNLPVIATNEKALAEEANKTLLQLFLDEKCFYKRGHKIPLGEFFEKFIEWMDPSFIGKWTKIRVGRELPSQFPKGRGTENVMFIGNISFTENAEPLNYRYISRSGKLEKVDGLQT